MFRTIALSALIFVGLVTIGGELPATPQIAEPAEAGIVCIEDMPLPCCIQVGLPHKDPIVSWCG